MRNFKKILITLLSFCLLLGGISLGFMEIYFLTEYDFFQDGSARDALSGKIDCLYLGASHGYRAFKPSVIDPILGTQSYNLSGSMMTLQGRYELLQEEIARNPVTRVYLELSFNSMTRNRATEGPEGDLYVLARLTGFLRRTGFFFRAFSWQEYPGVYQKFLSEGIDAAFQWAKGHRADHSQRDRGYMPTGSRTIAFEQNYDQIFHSRSYPTEIDPYDQAYLDKILALCKAQDVEVILVATPISKSALCQASNLQHFYSWYKELASNHGLQFYDFNLYKEKDSLLPDDTMYFDTLHLNDEGASLFSAVFANLVRRTESREDVNKLFYDSYPAMEQAVFGR